MEKTPPLNFQDLTGQQFGKLKVICRAPSRKSNTSVRTYWLCLCECGEVIEVRSDILKAGQKACRGCYTHDVEKPGDRFGRLTVLGRAPKRPDLKSRDSRWVCACDCGNIVEIAAASLKSGHTKSCGCYGKEVVAKQGKASATHGMRHTPEYHSWCSMKARCYNEKNKDFLNYGARGIVVCDRWLESFENFYEDMGNCPQGCSLDRIDNNGSYTPENCRWATRKEQNSNKRSNVVLTHNGITAHVADWAKITGLQVMTIHQRIRRGFSIEGILKPLKTKRRHNVISIHLLTPDSQSFSGRAYLQYMAVQ